MQPKKYLKQRNTAVGNILNGIAASFQLQIVQLQMRVSQNELIVLSFKQNIVYIVSLIGFLKN